MRNVDELLAGESPEFQARVKAKAAEMLLEINLAKIKEAGEKKAPTDEAIKLLAEMQEKAFKSVINNFRLPNNTVNAHVIFFQQPIDGKIAMIIRYAINGNKIESKIEFSMYDFDNTNCDAINARIIKVISADIAQMFIVGTERSYNMSMPFFTRAPDAISQQQYKFNWPSSSRDIDESDAESKFNMLTDWAMSNSNAAQMLGKKLANSWWMT